MLESLRNAGKSWVAKILLVMLAVSFGIWGIKDITGGTRGEVLATVGEQQISSQQYSESYRRALQDVAQRTGQVLTQEDARTLGYDKIVLDNLVQSAALDAQADHLALKVSPQAVVEAAHRIPAFKGADGKFDAKLFANVLLQNGMSEAAFVAIESRNRSRQALTAAVNGGFEPPSTLTEALTRHRDEQRDAKYFIISANDADVAASTDDELRKQYEATPAAYTAPEYRTIAVLKIEPSDIAAKMTVSEDELKAGYEKYKGEFFTPEKRTIMQVPFDSEQQAREAKSRISAGADFLDIARERKIADSDLTFADQTKSEFLDKAIADAAFALKPGEVSEVVKGSLVTALLKAQSVTPERQAPLDEVRDKLKLKLQTDRAQEEVQSVFDAVENARNSRTPFEQIGKAQGIPFNLVAKVSAAGLDQAGKEVEVPAKQDLLKAAFASDVGVENEPLHPNDSYYWYEVREVVPSALKPFDAVKEKVRNDVSARKLRDLLAERSKKAVDTLKAGSTLEIQAADYKAEVKQATGLRRNEATSEFDAASIGALFNAPENGFAWNLEGDGRTAKIMQSLPVISPPFDPKSALAQQIETDLKAKASNDIVTSYLAALRQQVGVTINEKLWQQVAGTTSSTP
jgi:peptidyl-prolyl cis-trans isomerase D